jgi:hypothetical protein
VFIFIGAFLSGCDGYQYMNVWRNHLPNDVAM